ncbi:Mini-ribonuclease 3 [Tindallia californiensis]|uniref:Mini-ribonuclease 3 n=1 Tax=Tindallia californiensis TaxID=159292 RepID=A0A1H3R9U0_9FIRM|nr:ribonuclease III domain-containing protein [Tindallia californiensis]SDZ22008.1 ribonuclease-3 family protein [Tindallia californiensis]
MKTFQLRGKSEEDKCNNNSTDINMISPLALAYMGDAVFELFVREYLVRRHAASVNKLHREAIKYVKAGSQAKVARRIKDFLSEEELWIMKRGRNQKSSTPKNADMVEYRHATGFEALIGFLYYQNRIERMVEIMEKSMSILDQSDERERQNET